MKLLFDQCRHNPEDDWYVNIGLGWYKHARQESKLFKSWKGITIVLYLIKWQFHITVVDDYQAYQARMNYRQGKK